MTENMENPFVRWGWSGNPFVLKIDPTLFTGYEEQVHAALRHIQAHHKIALVTGATGSGKTTMLKWLQCNVNGVSALYISKPPATPQEFTDIFIDTFGMTFWERAFGRKPTLYNLPAYVNKRIGKGQLLFMVDEAHESSKDVLEWLRVLVDQIESVSLILAGMPMLETDVLSKLETLNQRITTRIALTALSESETRSLISKRIEAVGGKGTEPFSDAAVTKIYSRTGGFPREVLKMADRLLNTALDKNIQVIDIDMIEEEHHEVPEVRLEEPAVTFTPRPPSDAQLANLPQKQRQIIEALNKTEWLTPAALTEQIEGEYASRGHAVRSINNILHRLMLDGYVQREARGKAFMYALTPKIKTMMVTS